MITVTKIIGSASEPAIAGRLHDLQHKGRLEILVVDQHNALRHRLRGTTDKGTEIAIALERHDKLSHGAVMLLENKRAIVVHMTETRWLRVIPRDADAALEIGYSAGNHHWRVKFEPGTLLVEIQGAADHYLKHLEHLINSGRIKVSDND